MRAPRRLVVVGDSLLDRDVEGSVERLCPDAPVPVVDEPTSRSRPGGAALAAALAARTGVEVTLVTALAADEGGAELRSLLAEAGVRIEALRLDGPTVEKIRVRADGRTLLRLDHGARTPAGIDVRGADLRRLEGATVLVSDYGRGVAALPEIRDALGSARAVVWDPHPRGPAPVEGCRLVTPNRAEAGLRPEAGIAEVSARARELARQWRAEHVAVTLGSNGALLVSALGVPFAFPAPDLALGDPCGAGDCFAMTAARAVGDGASAAESVGAAVGAASAFVAAGGAAHGLVDGLHDAQGLTPVGIAHAARVVAETRARGARVAATGGCFDLLHAGHIASLRAARALGGCLIVCLNSDDSVRRLKGPARPVVGEADRAAVLNALSFVDGVVVFQEDTPEAVLAELRPDVFVKGGDYDVAAMPEARLLRSWGGEAVLVPYVDGYSTSGLLKEAQRRAG